MVLIMVSRRKRARVTQFPVMEELNLKVSEQDVPLTQDFLFVKRIVFNIQWPAATVLFSTFGVDAALTNGIQLKYANRLILPHGIKFNSEFGEFCYDTRIDTDATAPKINTLTARLSIWKFTKNGEGLRLDPDRKFFIVVQDDLSSSANTHITANVQGWRYV
jgi:hypothetical protein